MKIPGNFIHFCPLKMSHFNSLWHAPLQVLLLLSILSPKWVAVLTLNLSAQHSAQVSHLHIPHQNFTSTHFNQAYEVMSCSTQLLTARTVMACTTSSASLAHFFNLVNINDHWQRDEGSSEKMGKTSLQFVDSIMEALTCFGNIQDATGTFVKMLYSLSCRLLKC